MGSNQNKNFVERRGRFIFAEMIKNLHLPNPSTYYEFLEMLGEGCYSEVHQVRLRETGQIRAIKKVQTANNPFLDRHLTNEFDILRRLDHPNILKIYEMFEYQASIYIVTEYLEGEDALELLKKRKTISEEQAFEIAYQSLLAIKYLHKQKVMHRDIKLENIIYNEKNGCFKLIDFGSALRYEGSSPRERRCAGTVKYLAPEVINQYYNNKCDIWSLGIVLYALLLGNAPFTGNSDEIIIQKILKHPLNFESAAWDDHSSQIKSLLAKMLEKNFEKRITTSEILVDPWIRKFKNQKQPNHRAITQCLQNMAKYTRINANELAYGILLFMTNFVIDFSDQAELVQSFNQIDISEDGELDEKEVKTALTTYNAIHPTRAQEITNDLMQKVDNGSTKLLSFTQFCVIGRNLREILTIQNIEKTFNFMDVQHRGRLSIANLQSRLGDHVQPCEYSFLLREYDKCEIGKVQFCRLMRAVLHNY